MLGVPSHITSYIKSNRMRLEQTHSLNEYRSYGEISVLRAWPRKPRLPRHFLWWQHCFSPLLLKVQFSICLITTALITNISRTNLLQESIPYLAPLSISLKCWPHCLHFWFLLRQSTNMGRFSKHLKNYSLVKVLDKVSKKHQLNVICLHHCISWASKWLTYLDENQSHC